MTKIEKQRTLLKELRSKLVGSQRTLPYTVYRDKDIEALLKAQPMTLEELGKVKGFPADGKRFTNYGNSILAVFKNPDSINSFSLDLSKSVPEIRVEAKKVNAFI